jgi:hypothetical protein
MSILAGIGSLVDQWLQIAPKGKPPYYRHRSAALDLSRRNSPINGTQDFLDASYAKIHSNWLAAIETGDSNPSKENWRWKRHLELSPENTSPELRLERSIVNACGDSWSNQMPTASGLVGPAADKRAAVDLVYRENPTTYSLIELKVDSDSPLFATIEILMHGLLFVWSRNNQELLGYDLTMQPVLAAKTITLAVLAPCDYYRDFELMNLVSAIDDGLTEFGRQYSLDLGFQFHEFGMADASDSRQEALRAMQEIFTERI